MILDRMRDNAVFLQYIQKKFWMNFSSPYKCAPVILCHSNYSASLVGETAHVMCIKMTVLGITLD